MRRATMIVGSGGLSTRSGRAPCHPSWAWRRPLHTGPVRMTALFYPRTCHDAEPFVDPDRPLRSAPVDPVEAEEALAPPPGGPLCGPLTPLVTQTSRRPSARRRGRDRRDEIK